MLRKVLSVKALAIAGLVAGTATAAAAADVPAAAQDGLANAAQHVGITLPASSDNHPTKDEHPGNKDDSTPPPDVDGDESDEPTVDEPSDVDDGNEADEPDGDESDEPDGESDDGTTRKDNHGAVVSEFAHTTDLTGRERGQAIAEVARGDHGPGDDESGEDADDDDSSENAPSNVSGDSGHGHSNGHGNGHRKH